MSVYLYIQYISSEHGMQNDGLVKVSSIVGTCVMIKTPPLCINMFILRSAVCCADVLP